MSSRADALSPPNPKGAILPALARRWRLGLLAIAAAGFAVPIGMLAHGTASARACVARYEAPRGPELPACKQEIRWFVLPSRMPWTATPARYRAEELNMRVAIATYEDAAVGRPDAAALKPSGDAVVAGEKVMAAGSQRVALEELGKAVGAPDLGRSAMLLGDRRTLLARADQWAHWSVRRRTLLAALLEGDVPRAASLANRYAEWDPRDEDLRTAIAAMLCLSGGGKRGMELLGTVQADRAKGRHENWTRNWGEVRAMTVACAAKAGVTAPPAPEAWEAGAGDRGEARAALRLRILRGGDATLIRDTAAIAVQMLKKALPAGARLPLAAAVLAAGHALDAGAAVEITTPRAAEGEPPLRGPARDLTAAAWMDREPGLSVIAPPSSFRDAAAALRRLSGGEEVTAEARAVLLTAAAAATIAAARGFAEAGDAASAVGAIDAAGEELRPAERALARASARYVAGDAAAALGDLAADPPDLAADPALHAALLLQRAELLASNGKRDEAARAVIAADEAAARAGDRALDLRAQWTRLALSGSRRASVAARVEDRAWPWTGPMASPAAWLPPDAEGEGTLPAALAFWDGARRASPDLRRAVRYAAFRRHQGDAPRWLAPYLFLGGELLAPGEGDVEVWLDAFAAAAATTTTLRAYAWSRMEAARFRGDATAAAAWAARYATLQKLAAPAANAELAASLGI